MAYTQGDHSGEEAKGNHANLDAYARFFYRFYVIILHD